MTSENWICPGLRIKVNALIFFQRMYMCNNEKQNKIVSKNKLLEHMLPKVDSFKLNYFYDHSLIIPT